MQGKGSRGSAGCSQAPNPLPQLNYRPRRRLHLTLPSMAAAVSNSELPCCSFFPLVQVTLVVSGVPGCSGLPQRQTGGQPGGRSQSAVASARGRARRRAVVGMNESSRHSPLAHPSELAPSMYASSSPEPCRTGKGTTGLERQAASDLGSDSRAGEAGGHEAAASAWACWAPAEHRPRSPRLHGRLLSVLHVLVGGVRPPCLFEAARLRAEQSTRAGRDGRRCTARRGGRQAATDGCGGGLLGAAPSSLSAPGSCRHHPPVSRKG